MGTRLSKLNYCSLCEYRTKTDEGKAWCEEYNKAISDSQFDCWLLKPFQAYEEKNSTKKKKRPFI